MEKSPEVIYDESLVLRCQSGEEAALNELVQRWHPKLLRHAAHLTERQEAARDVVQESWLAIVRGLNRLDDPASFPKWAYRIVTNKCADWTRRRQRQRKLNAHAAEEVVETRDDPFESLEVDDELQQLRIALRQMPGEQRAILSMCYLEGMPLRDIAQALSIPIGTVKSRLFHARERLKRLLKRSSKSCSG